MSTAAALTLPRPLPKVTSGDRLGLTVFFAVVMHAIVILGVSFAPEDGSRVNRNTIEIILVPSKSDKAPEKTDYLAQANQDGGGDSEKKERPSTPLPAPFVSKQAVVPAATPKVQAMAPVPARPAKKKPVVVQKHAATKVKPKPTPVRQIKPKPMAKTKPRPQVEPVRQISASELFTSSTEIASLNADISRRLQAYAERPRRKFINARTREYKYAAYMEAWRAKVERIGNLNYPDEARRKKLSGSLLLDVALNPDGGIREVILRRSSGHKALDDAAERIVRLAAPYAPFPKNIRDETDILHIERTWQFLGSNRLFAR